ncbi:MAG: HAD-IA family hydrolase [Chloroflexi bacterium]|nr:HAD-IA family hydrolase [Chloroflexota bacterium]
MNQPLNIEAVLFDADGVLQQEVEGGREKIACLDGSATPNEAFLQDLFRAEMPCLRGDADLADTVGEVLKKWDSPYSVEHAIETHTKIVAVNPESIEVVRALRMSGIGAYLATNQHEYRARYMSEVFGYANIFDGEFYSCRVGAMKPDPNYFHAILKSLPYRPEQLLFIDDRDRNVAAAKSVGIHGVEYELGEGIGALREILREYGLDI